MEKRGEFPIFSPMLVHAKLHSLELEQKKSSTDRSRLFAVFLRNFRLRAGVGV